MDLEIASITLMEYHPTMDPRLFRGRIERFRLVRRVDWDLVASQAEAAHELASSTGVPVMLMQSDPLAGSRSNFAMAMTMQALLEDRVVSFVSMEMPPRDLDRMSR